MKRLLLILLALFILIGCKKDTENFVFPTWGYKNNHAWIDLGLPSGTKWATCNVGAAKPEDYGSYYAWGEVDNKTNFTMANSKTNGKNMTDISGSRYYDAATANWGGTWRMPTKAEIEELVNNCTWTWTTLNSVNGYRVTGSNGNSIFFPAAGHCYGSSSTYVGEGGYYWCSTPNGSDSYIACSLYFGSGGHYVDWLYRYYGLTVRPVSE